MKLYFCQGCLTNGTIFLKLEQAKGFICVHNDDDENATLWTHSELPTYKHINLFLM
jgi:hypothetical protein